MSEEYLLNEPIKDEFEIFKGVMEEENLQVQIEITKKLSSLAKHLGEESTRNELLPFITENIDYHDEILLNLSEQLKEFIPLVGGYRHSQPILDLLTKLCHTDETIVRDKAVDALKSIAEKISDDLAEELLLPVVEKLSVEEWFTSKCSAAALYPTIYSKVKEDKKSYLRTNFCVLCQDDSPIVRKAAALSLTELINCMQIDCIKNEIVPIFYDISDDIMDSVREISIDVAIALAKRFSEIEIEELVFNKIEERSDDNSWKIRQRIAYNISAIQKVIPFAKTRGKILLMFQKLIKDSEAQVRIFAAKNLFNYCANLKETYKSQPQYEDNFEPVFLQSIVPQIHLLLVDPNEDVRLALSLNLLSLSSILREECFKTNILSLLVEILENESSMLIQANMLQNLNLLPTNVDLTMSLHSIKNVIRALIINSQSHWRTRRSILVAFMHITRFASSDFFSKNLKVLYAALLGDPVFAIRKTTPILLPLLAKVYGIEWASENLVPYFTMFTKNSKYLYRLIPLFGINELINPSLNNGKDINYLKDLKNILDSSTTIKVKKHGAAIMYRVYKMVEQLQEKIKEKSFQNIIVLNDCIDNFKNDNIKLYAEDVVDILQNDINNCNVFELTEETILESGLTYIEGLLSLLYREFFVIIETLNRDPIENIQIRSVFTMNKVQLFVNKLSQEIDKLQIKETISVLTEDELKYIEEEVVKDFNRKTIQKYDDKIDTELMDNSITLNEETLPDLGNVPELEINTNDKSRKGKNIVENEKEPVIVHIKLNPEVEIDNKSSTSVSKEKTVPDSDIKKLTPQNK